MLYHAKTMQTNYYTIIYRNIQPSANKNPCAGSWPERPVL